MRARVPRRNAGLALTGSFARAAPGGQDDRALGLFEPAWLDGEDRE